MVMSFHKFTLTHALKGGQEALGGRYWLVQNPSIYSVYKRIMYLMANWAGAHQKAHLRVINAWNSGNIGDAALLTICKYLCKAV